MNGKSLFTKKIGFLCIVTLFLGMGANMLYSSVQPSMPHILENDQPADSVKFNENLDYLKQLITEKNALIKSVIPAGTVFTYSGERLPSGFYECDGQAVSRDKHPELFSAIGTMYGAGDGSSTFNLPDYRGYFLRGLNNRAGRDPDAGARDPRPDGVDGDNMGTTQSSDFKSHKHFEDAVPGYDGWGGGGSGHNDFALRGASRTKASGGAETRPKNIAVVYIIKAR